MKILYVTNIPTPYRRYRFDVLDKLLTKRGHTLEVLFMAETEPERQWDPIENMEGFSARMFFNINLASGRSIGHFNPGLLWKVYRSDYDVVIVGGYASPSHFLSILLAKKNRLVLSIESNLSSMKQDNWIVNFIRKIVFNKADAFQITGDKVKDYLNYHKVKTDKPLIFLPNIIDEIAFTNKSITPQPPTSKLVVFCAARMSEVKGILPLINAISAENKERIVFRFAGDGPLLEQAQNLINSKEIDAELLGNIDPEEVKNNLKNCDAFLLPSINDASPLSVIEALALSKPLLLSTRIGNISEALIENENGFSFDIFSEESINSALNKMYNSKVNNDLMALGKKSGLIYSSIFESNQALNNYIDCLESIFND